MTVGVVGLALVAVAYLGSLTDADGDEAGYAAAAKASANVRPNTAHDTESYVYFFVVSTTDERLALETQLATETAIRTMVGDRPRKAWVAVAIDDMEEATLAAIIADQNAFAPQHLVFVSLRRNRELFR